VYLAQRENSQTKKVNKMKTLKVLTILAAALMTVILPSCNKNESEPPATEENIIPERFTIDIPNSISSYEYYKDANIDTLQGNDIYNHLRTFIYVGEHAAGVVGELILAISLYHLSQPMTFSFTSESDGRLKTVVIIENALFEDHTWEYKMTITDSGADAVESTAAQVFWDKNPIEGISILNPYNLDRNTDPKFMETMYRIDYSETGSMGYAYHMIVTLDGLPLEDPLENPYSVSTLKMFVGKNDETVSVYGNTEHPNAKFFTSDTGFDWAFVAAGRQSEDIGVAEVGLPPNTLDSGDREVLLVDNSIKNVFTEQIYAVWPWIDSTSVQAYLYNTEAPGFFNHDGFIQGGTPPSPAYDPLVNLIAGLTPYNPAAIHELTVEFDE
jgi:hypothetical protein